VSAGTRTAPTGQPAANITFTTARMDGFKTAGCDLARRIDRTFNDSQLFYGFALRGHDGSTAYEGQVSGTPKSLRTRTP
jgi:hypothetical protein